MTIKWFKDGVEIGSGETIEVAATDFDETAVYSYIAYDEDGTALGQAEVTLANVMDGESGSQGPEGPQGPQGEAGERGGVYLKVTTAPSAYTTQVGSFTPSYRISKSTVLSQSGSSDVKVGDVLEYSYYHYPVGYVSDTYVYTTARQSLRGAAGSSVTISKIEYGTSGDASTPPSSWSETVPTFIAKGLWLWVKTTYSNSTEATTKSYIGTDGEDGTSVFVQSATKTGDTTTVVLADSEGHTNTLTIVDGQDGSTGQPGQNGLPGYVHTAWANSADGSTDFSTTVSTNKMYLGVYTDNTAADSTNYQDYSWSLIKGAQGEQGPQGETGPEAVVTIYPDTIDWNTGSASLAVMLHVNGVITEPVSYSWTKGTNTTPIGTDATLNVTDLDTIYNCNVTWSGGTQTGSYDFVAAKEAYERALLDSALIYDHTYTEENGAYTFTAALYRGAEDITSQADPERFVWILRTEAGDSLLGRGLTITVNETVAGYRASIIGGYEDVMEMTLVTDDGTILVTDDGSPLFAYMEDEFDE